MGNVVVTEDVKVRLSRMIGRFIKRKVVIQKVEKVDRGINMGNHDKIVTDKGTFSLKFQDSRKETVVSDICRVLGLAPYVSDTTKVKSPILTRANAVKQEAVLIRWAQGTMLEYSRGKINWTDRLLKSFGSVIAICTVFQIGDRHGQNVLLDKGGECFTSIDHESAFSGWFTGCSFTGHVSGKMTKDEVERAGKYARETVNLIHDKWASVKEKMEAAGIKIPQSMEDRDGALEHINTIIADLSRNK